MAKYADYPGVENMCLVDKSVQVLAPCAQVDNAAFDELITNIWVPDNVNLHYLPWGLKKIFPNLKKIDIASNDTFKHLDKQNLQEFGDDLEHFSVVYGNLTVLKKDLFDYNRKLKFIRFFGNPLKYIEPGFFENIAKMKHLKFFDLANCNCIDEYRSSGFHKEWTHNCTAIPKAQ